MAILTKEQLLKKVALPTVDVPCPELGEGAVVRLRMLKAVERDRWEAAVSEDGKMKKENIRAQLVAACVIGEDGGDVAFSAADIVALGEQRSDVVDRLFDAALDLNKLRRKDVESEKNVSAGKGPVASCFDSPLPPGVATPTNLPADRSAS